MNEQKATPKPASPDALVSKAAADAVAASEVLNAKQAEIFQAMLEKGTSNASEWTVFFRGVLKSKEGSKL